MGVGARKRPIDMGALPYGAPTADRNGEQTQHRERDGIRGGVRLLHGTAARAGRAGWGLEWWGLDGFGCDAGRLGGLGARVGLRHDRLVWLVPGAEHLQILGGGARGTRAAAEHVGELA